MSGYSDWILDGRPSGSNSIQFSISSRQHLVPNEPPRIWNCGKFQGGGVKW
jgi:hypothetical protein